MKRFLSLFGLLALCCTLTLCAASPDVRVSVTDFTLAITPGSRTVTLTPVALGSVRTGTSDSTGNVTLSAVLPADYTFTISGSDLSLTLRVPQSHALLQAKDLIVGAWTRPTPAGSGTAKANLAAWSLLSTAEKQDYDADLAGWALIPTNDMPTLASVAAKQAALTAASALTGSNATLNGWLKLSGQTNQIGDNGTALTFNGAPVGGGDTVWTNAETAVVLVSRTNRVFIGSQGDAYVEDFVYGLGVANKEVTTTTNVLYDVGGTIGIVADTPAGHGTVQSVGVLGTGTYGSDVAYGVIGLGVTVKDNSAAIGVSGASFDDGFTNTVQIGGYFEVGASWSGPDPVHESAVLLLDSRASNVPLITGRTNNGTTVFSVAASGLAASVAGFASTDTTAPVNIAETGWTNTFGKNAVVYYDGTAVTATVYNNAGTAVYTNAVALTGNSSILLQPSGAVILSGTGVAGRATPF